MTKAAFIVGVVLRFFLDAGFHNILLVFAVHLSVFCGLDSPRRQKKHLWVELAAIVGAGLWLFLDVRVLLCYCNDVSLVFGVRVWLLLGLDSPRSARRHLWAGLSSTVRTFLGPTF